MDVPHPLLHIGGIPPLCSNDTQLGVKLGRTIGLPSPLGTLEISLPIRLLPYGAFLFSGASGGPCAQAGPYAALKRRKSNMSTKVKSNALFPHPFSKQYWRLAAAELKDVKMLVLAALLIALRVALKPVAITWMPNVQTNAAMFVNALGAMIFGPVVAIPAAFISDLLGAILFPQGPYFLPFALTEIGSSVIFAMLLYRQRVTTTRVIIGRFCICFFINILLQAPIMLWYYAVILGKSYTMFALPQILKNLFMFPFECVLISLFLSVMCPITYRMKMTYDGNANLKFNPKQIILLVCLFILGVVSIFSYLTYYYNTTSRSASYTAEERFAANQMVDAVVHDKTDTWDADTTVTIVESAYRGLTEKDTTYTVAVYVVDPEAGADMNTLWGLSKSKAASNEALTRVAGGTIVVNEKTGEVGAFAVTAD